MGTSRRARVALAVLALVVLLSGCFGYNSSAKRWAYVGDSVLILGGGAAIATDLLGSEEACMGDRCPSYESPVSGAIVVGAVLVTAGVIGMLINATRPNVKSSR